MEQEGLKIIKAVVENYKNIKFQEIKFDGRSIIVAGKNGSGKSSLIQAITSPVNSKSVPTKPIKDGEEYASVKLQVAGVLDGEKAFYNVDLYFTPQNQKGRLVISDESGNKISDKKSILDSIVGDISFDIFEFTRLAKTSSGKISKPGVMEQVKLLQSFLSDAEKKELFTIDNKVAQKMEQRKFKKYDLDTKQALFDSNPYSQEEIKKYEKEIDTEVIYEKLKGVEAEQVKYDKATSYLEAKKQENAAVDKNIADNLAEIENIKQRNIELEAQKANNTKNMHQTVDYLANKSRPTSSAIMDELNAANEHNAKVAEVAKYATLITDIRTFKDDITNQTSELDRLKTRKATIYKESNMPVEGLSFTEDAVLYNGLPFTEEQINSAKIIEVGAKVAMALNPNLRVITIKDGSLLDDDTFKMVLDLVEANNYQLLIEMVDRSAGELTVEFVESKL